ncbi:MAG: 16S rRNA (adenine(1518)-N(6)/adenine(1519)-N(6))-dimethyltransferase RsmA [Anaerolineales bacterium]
MVENPRDLLSRYDLSPRRSLGQNFLVDPRAPRRIAAGADVGPEDIVLEVGAGVGTLTEALAERAARVLAVETDPALVEALEDLYRERARVEVIPGDILELDPAALLGVEPPEQRPLWGARLEHYLVVANLPYYITAAVMRHLLEAAVRPARMVVTVQKEVAQRIVAADGKMSLLAVGVHFYGKPRTLFRLKRGAFYPVPKVESAVLRLDLYEEPPVEVDDVATFFDVVRAGFAQRRKQLKNTLAATLHLDSNAVAEAMESHGVPPTRRAETLSLEEWARVVRALEPLLPPSRR